MDRPVAGRIEPKFYRIILGNQFFFDFDGMPQVTKKKWGELVVPGYEGKLIKRPNEPNHWAFVPFVHIICILEVRQEEVNAPQLILPHGGTLG